jgi:hypothetical protein
MDLDVWVEEQITKENVQMSAILNKYPYVEENQDGQHGENFHSDEEPENSESQKEDMKIYLSKLNKKIDILVESLKDAENVIKTQTDRKNISDLIK